MTRRHRTALQRARIFTAHGGKCHLCGERIDGVKQGYELDHIIALALGGKDEEANLAPAHRDCHRAKSKGDTTGAAKVKRVAAKHMGGRPKHRWPARKFNQPRFSNVKQLDRL